MNHTLKAQRGFTLLELLIVVAVIAILASAVVANLSSARNKAYDTQVQRNLKAVSTSIEVYTSTAAPDEVKGNLENKTFNQVVDFLKQESFLDTDTTITHPTDTTTGYQYSGSMNGASLSYTLKGKLPSQDGQCHIITNGSARDGSC